MEKLEDFIYKKWLSIIKSIVNYVHESTLKDISYGEKYLLQSFMFSY